MASSNGQQKLLKYASYDVLKEVSKLDKKILATLKKLNVKKCYQHFYETEQKARTEHQAGNDEDAFICYHRALEIFRVINDNMDDSFKRSKDGRDFYEISNRIFMSISLLSEKLKSMYQSQGASEQQVQKPIEQANPAIIKAEGSKRIKPKELIRFIETGNAVLVIDYRIDQDKFIKFESKEGSIDVVHLEPQLVILGCLLHTITKTLDMSVRPYLEKIAQYDLVILLGDVNDIDEEKGSKTRILYEALTTYNRTNKLKTPPLILEHGFELWEMTYPNYTATKDNIPKFEKSFDEQFRIWMNESKKACELNITYPNLTEFGVQPIADESGSLCDRRTPQMPMESMEVKRFSRNEIMVPPNKIQTTHQIPEATIPKNIPHFDRSNKPSNFSTLTGFKRNEKNVEDLVVHNKENGKANKIDENTTMPQLATLGGAQLNFDTDTTKRAQISQPRPPTPDRSTKRIIAQQTPHSSGYFTKSYEMAYATIADDSSYKQATVKPGCTGLVNMGNTCFMNATLQALFHTPGFLHLFRNQTIARFINTKNSLGTQGIISGCFAAMTDLAWSGRYSALRPYFFLQIFAQRVNATLADRQQHDAQEFQIFLLDALHEDTNKIDKRRPFEQNYDSSNLVASAQDFIKKSNLFSSSPVNDIFNLTTVSTIQCKTCDASSVCFEGLNQISLELPTENGRILKLKDCLSTHFSTTMLDAPWECPRCRCKRMASRTTKIWNIPKILIIHFKRFSLSSGHFVKNEIDVNFEIENLSLAPYIHPKASPAQYNERYNLYAVTNHSGTLNRGHYTSHVKNLDQEWLYFDDENCYRRGLPSSMNKQAFLLYYALDTGTGTLEGIR